MTTDNTEKVKRGRYTFLINREKGTAWIEAASSGRRKKFALPKSVEINGRTFICESVEAGAFCGNRKLRHLRVPDTYKYLDEDCFICSDNLRSVHIGKGLDYYFKWSFSCCPNLERVTIDPDNPYIKISDDGAFVLTKDGKRVLAIIPRRTLKQVIVPEGVEKIESGAISCCDTLTKISLPSTLKEIRANGIFENKSLRGLKVPEGVSMLDIQAISYNETLEKIDLPSTCREINYDSLEENSSLKTLILRSDTIVNVKTGNVGDVMHTCKLYVPEHLVGQYSNHPQWSIMKIESLKYYDKIQPNKKTIRKALHNRFLIYMMREAISDGRGVTAEAYLMDALIGLYNVLYYDPALKTPCSVKEFIEKIRQENLIVDENRTIIGKDGDMGEVQLKSGIWRIQMDSLPAYSGIGSSTKEDMLIAYILGIGNSVHCCITIGEHFLEFLHEVDDWIPLIKQYLERYFLAAEKMERIEAISRKTFEPLVKGIMEDTGFRYKAEYHNVSCVELIVWLSNGSKVKFSLGMDDFTKGCYQIKEDIQTLDTLARRYGTRMSIGHDRSK